MLPVLIGKAIATAVGGLLGKAAEKAITFIPDKSAYMRNKKEALEKEQDDLKTKLPSKRRDDRLRTIAILLHNLNDEAFNKLKDN